MNWRKSMRSMNHGACVEAASWREEAGHGPGVVGVRDSQLGGAGRVLEFSAAAWTAFTAGLR